MHRTDWAGSKSSILAEERDQPNGELIADAQARVSARLLAFATNPSVAQRAHISDIGRCALQRSPKALDDCRDECLGPDSAVARSNLSKNNRSGNAPARWLRLVLQEFE